MSGVSDVDVVRKLYAAMAVRDPYAIAALLDAEIVIDQDERLPWGGHHVGIDGFVEFAGTLTDTVASAVTIDAIFEASGRVVETGRTKGTVVATGVPFDVPEVHIWTVRNGRIVAGDLSIDTAAMLAALAAPADDRQET